MDSGSDLHSPQQLRADVQTPSSANLEDAPGSSRGSGSLRMLPAAPEGRGHAKSRAQQDAAAPSCHAKLQPPARKRRGNAYPAKALHADVIGVGAAGRPVDDAIPQLVIRRVSRHPAEQLAPILHQDWGWEGGKPGARYPVIRTPSP